MTINIKKILDIKIDDINQTEALKTVEDFLHSKTKHYIVTPNPEIIVAAQSDVELKEILNKADLSVPDGVGLKLAGVKNKVAGVDLMLDLVKLASEKGYSVGFIGGKPGIAQNAAEVLKKKCTNLKVSFATDGGIIDKQGNVIARSEATKQSSQKENPSQIASLLLAMTNTDILFVAFGVKKQEKWIDAYLPKLPVKVAMTVGGSLDYIAGNVPRAPKPVRDLGLEWLFRLIIQPWRIKRQLALVQFVRLVLTKKI